jgi:hypothetical protein
MRDIAIRNTHPSVVTINGDTEATDSTGTKVTLDEPLITIEINRLQAEYDSQEYSRSRKSKYDLLNQDEMRYDDLKNNTNTWELAIDAIKLEHPKETS